MDDRTPGSDRLAGSLAHRAPVVLAVIVGSVLVALGSGGLDLFGAPAPLDEERTTNFRIAGAVAALVGLVLVLAQRRHLRSGGKVLGRVAGVMAAVALVSYLAPSMDFLEDLGTPLGSMEYEVGGEGTNPIPPPGLGGRGGVLGTGGYGSHADQAVPGVAPAPEEEEAAGWIDRDLLLRGGAVLLVLLLVALIVLGVMMMRGRLPGHAGTGWSYEAEPEPPDSEEKEKPETDEPSEDPAIGRPLHPERPLEDAYERLLKVLAEIGLPRRPHEAPYEHLRRAIRPLKVRPEPMLRLAELHVLEHFGRRALTPDERKAAAAALGESLDALNAGKRP